MTKTHRDAKHALIIGLQNTVRTRTGMPRGAQSEAIATYLAESLIGEQPRDLPLENDRVLARDMLASDMTADDKRLAASAAWSLAQVRFYSAWDGKTASMPKRDSDEALRLLLRSTTLWPVSKMFQTLAQVYISTGDVKNGYRAASRAVELDENDGEATRLKGNAAGLMERYEEAEQLFIRAAMLLPPSAQPLIHASIRELYERRT